MKRKIVLLCLLVLPLALYVYFSLAKHNSLFLPVITEDVSEIPAGKTFNDTAVVLKDKITVLGFLGQNVLKKKESIFNINQKVNSKYKEFNDFQIVMVAPEGTQDEVLRLQTELKVMADISNWKFVFLAPKNIVSIYNSLQVSKKLDADNGTFEIFIIDKERSLRGRKGKNKKGEDEYRDSYNSFSAAELHNEMTDDLKIVLREYRLALKKNSNLKGVKREI